MNPPRSATLRQALAAALRVFLGRLLGKEMLVMPQIQVGDPPATLRAVEKKAGETVPIAGALEWSLSPSDGLVAELAPGDSPDTVKLLAKSPGTVTAGVADPAFSLSASLEVEVVAPPPDLTPDSIEIEFEPGSPT